MNPQNQVPARIARPITMIAALMVVAALTNGLVIGCGGKSQSTDQGGESQSTPPPSSTEPSAATTPPPAASGEASLDLGAKVYTQRCVLCHGATGHGDGVGAAALNPKPRNHTDGAYMNSRTDDQLLEVIRNGKGAMPAWGKVLSDEEIHAVLKHVRSLAQPPYPGPH